MSSSSKVTSEEKSRGELLAALARAEAGGFAFPPAPQLGAGTLPRIPEGRDAFSFGAPPRIPEGRDAFSFGAPPRIPEGRDAFSFGAPPLVTEGRAPMQNSQTKTDAKDDEHAAKRRRF